MKPYFVIRNRPFLSSVIRNRAKYNSVIRSEALNVIRNGYISCSVIRNCHFLNFVIRTRRPLVFVILLFLVIGEGDADWEAEREATCVQSLSITGIERTNDEFHHDLKYRFWHAFLYHDRVTIPSMKQRFGQKGAKEQRHCPTCEANGGYRGGSRGSGHPTFWPRGVQTDDRGKCR